MILLFLLLLPDNSYSNPPCRLLSVKVRESLHPPSPSLSGVWVTKHCSTHSTTSSILYSLTFRPGIENKTLVLAMLHQYTGMACSETAVSAIMQGTLQGDRVFWQGGQDRVVWHGGSLDSLASLRITRLGIVHSQHRQRRLVVIRQEGEVIIEDELVRYKKVSAIMHPIDIALQGIQEMGRFEIFLISFSFAMSK